MKQEKRKYDEEFKKTVVELYENGKSVKDLAGEYGLNDRKLIYSWIKKYGKIQTSSGKTIRNNDYAKLQKQNKELKEEIEILKKAVAIFTKP